MRESWCNECDCKRRFSISLLHSECCWDDQARQKVWKNERARKWKNERTKSSSWDPDSWRIMSIQSQHHCVPFSMFLQVGILTTRLKVSSKIEMEIKFVFSVTVGKWEGNILQLWISLVCISIPFLWIWYLVKASQNTGVHANSKVQPGSRLKMKGSKNCFPLRNQKAWIWWTSTFPIFCSCLLLFLLRFPVFFLLL